MKDSFFETLKEKARPYFTDGSGHGFDHTERVYKNALKISQGEELDLDVVKASALLHDICRGDENSKKIECHAEGGAKLSSEILKELGFPEDKVEKVAYAIKVHRHSKGINPDTIEAKILQDADRLDALGAISVARIFEYGGKTGKPTHRPDNLKIPKPSKEEECSLYQFYKKILKITPDKFHTKKAQEIAKSRYEFVKQFVERFLEEWNGEA